MKTGKIVRQKGKVSLLIAPGLIAFLLFLLLSGYAGVEPAAAGPAGGMIIDHTCTDIKAIPESAIAYAKSELHIAYGHTSHGSQLTSGMTDLVGFMNGLGYTEDLYAWNNGGTGGALDLHDYAMPGDLGNPDRVTWAQETRDYLGPPDASGRGSLNPDVNVIMWSWCGQVDGSESDIDTYLSLMSGLETEYPAVNFVYMTGHLNGTGADGNVNIRNQQIRDYCTANNKILYDFADIESYDPDAAVNYMPLLCNDNCDYDSDDNGTRDSNWATDWQGSHVQDVDWYSCSCAHSQPLNGNRKAYAAWWMFAGIAGWNQPVTHSITVTQGENGSIAPAGTSGVVTVNEGGDQAFDITPDEDYRVAGVMVDGKPQGAITSYTFSNVSADHTISATFEPADLATWYLAEGSTDWGFYCYISILNPNDTAVNVRLTYMPTDGENHTQTVSIPANSQATVTPSDTLGAKDFSTKVECLEGKAIAVDRTMEWNGNPGNLMYYIPAAHNSIGVTSLATTWYLPEGSTQWGFETWLLIQNPNNTEATCKVTYMIEGGEPAAFEKKIPANSRRTCNMADDIGAADASIKVESDLPVIPERSMYRNDRREGHDSIGTTMPSTDYYLAEGATGYGSEFITYVLVQNPQDSVNRVTITYLTGSGEVAGPAFDMPPNSRQTIRVNDQLPPDTDVSTVVHGEAPIIAERAMYWGEGTDGITVGESCHDSIGLAASHNNFYLPDGGAGGGSETWTLVQNPNGTDVEVEITYMTEGGTGNRTFSDLVPAGSRRTYNMADQGISGRAGIMVTSKTAGAPIMCERAMYWDSHGTGTDTIGGYSD